jgi:hypothetical protein
MILQVMRLRETPLRQSQNLPSIMSVELISLRITLQADPLYSPLA